AAAQRLHLRHQFGAEGLGDAHASVLLQCGVTRRACRERLYLWLDGRESPETLERLLRGPLASESFADLWAHLYHFRHGNIPEEQLRYCVATNPWVLPQWEDELVANCLKQDEAAAAAAAAGADVTALPPPAPPPFLSEPVLKWE